MPARRAPRASRVGDARACCVVVVIVEDRGRTLEDAAFDADERPDDQRKAVLFGSEIRANT